MPIRNGAQYLASLRDQRQVIYQGERVPDVTTAPGFRRAARAIARFYDFQSLPEMADVMTWVTPDGERVGTSFMEPRSREDLRRRVAAWAAWSDVTCGFMGRSPDYMNTCLSTLASEDVHLSSVNPELGVRARRAYDKARRNDECYTHTFIEAFGLRGDGPRKPTLQIRQTKEGVHLTGLRGLATIAPFANYNFSIETEPFIQEDGSLLRCSFTHPMAMPGLRWLCRDSFDTEPRPYDAPLSVRGDEMDCVAILEDCFVPWEDVVVFGAGERNVAQLSARVRNVFSAAKFHNMVRAISKGRLLFGIAHLLADSSKVNQFANVKERLGEMVHMLQTLQAFVMAAIEGASPNPDTGVWHPHFETTQVAGSWFAEFYPRMVDIVRNLAASRVFSSPGEQTMDVVGPVLEQHLRAQGAATPEGGIKDYVSLYRLAWDVIGSSWGVRQDMYERFSVGGSNLRRMRDYGIYDKREAIEAVARVLGSVKRGETEAPFPKRPA